MNPESYRGQIPTSRILLQFNCILRKNAARYRTWGRTGRSTPVRRRRVCQTRRTVLSGGVHRTGLVLQFHSQCNCQGNVGFPYIINRVTDSKELVSAAAHREYRFKKKAGLGGWDAIAQTLFHREGCHAVLVCEGRYWRDDGRSGCDRCGDRQQGCRS